MMRTAFLPSTFPPSNPYLIFSVGSVGRVGRNRRKPYSTRNPGSPLRPNFSPKDGESPHDSPKTAPFSARIGAETLPLGVTP